MLYQSKFHELICRNWQANAKVNMEMQKIYIFIKNNNTGYENLTTDFKVYYKTTNKKVIWYCE